MNEQLRNDTLPLIPTRSCRTDDFLGRFAAQNRKEGQKCTTVTSHDYELHAEVVRTSRILPEVRDTMATRRTPLKCFFSFLAHARWIFSPNRNQGRRERVGGGGFAFQILTTPVPESCDYVARTIWTRMSDFLYTWLRLTCLLSYTLDGFRNDFNRTIKIHFRLIALHKPRCINTPNPGVQIQDSLNL